MTQVGEVQGLSAGQLRFAELECADVVMAGDYGRVFLYRTGPGSTWRWLVDRHGRAIETVRFGQR
jgi:hypothetical protein